MGPSFLINSSQEAKLNLTKIYVATVLLLLILLQYINITELFFFLDPLHLFVLNFFVFLYKIIISKFVWGNLSNNIYSFYIILKWYSTRKNLVALHIKKLFPSILLMVWYSIWSVRCWSREFKDEQVVVILKKIGRTYMKHAPNCLINLTTFVIFNQSKRVFGWQECLRFLCAARHIYLSRSKAKSNQN